MDFNKEIVKQEIIADLEHAPLLVNRYFSHYTDEEIKITIKAIDSIYAIFNKQKFILGD